VITLLPMPLPRREKGGFSLRAQRLKLAWLLAPLFLMVARPSPGALLAGAVFSLSGLVLRGVAAGAIDKDKVLATEGVYARLRHPLYLGSFLVGLGLAMGGGRWWILALYPGLFAWVYRRAIAAEEEALGFLFGEAYGEYRAQVPAFLPRIRRGSARPEPSGTEPGSARRSRRGFRLALYMRNREWEAALGTLAGYVLLLARMWVGA